MAEEKKKEEKKSWFGGLFGSTEKKVSDRKKALQDAAGYDEQSAQAQANGEQRPPQSRKWIEE